MEPRLTLRLLGPFSVERAGRRLALPQSKKTRALLAYLASTGRAHRRTRLCELLWPDVDDPRGGLRWALSRLRPLVDDEERTRLCADAQTVSFDAADVWIDAVALAQLDFASADTRELLALNRACRGPFWEDLELPELLEVTSFCVAERERLGQRRRLLLDELVARHAGEPEQAVTFARERAALDPQEGMVQAQLIEQLVAAGQLREAEEHQRAQHEWLESQGQKPGARLLSAQLAIKHARERQRAAEESPPPADSQPAPVLQEIRFCTTTDGVRIAYSKIGAGPPLLKTANWLNHLEFDFQSPIWHHWLRELSREHSLVRYDERGNGLSDREVPELSLRAFVEDLEAVAKAAGLTRYALFGMSQGCPVAIAHAVRFPERVSHLILFNGFVQGFRARGRSKELENAEALITLARHGWGGNHPAFRQVFTSLFFPEAPGPQMRDFNELQRKTASPEQAVRLFAAIGDLDVRELLPQVRVPTLVLHSRHDGLIPFKQGRELAAGIPGARFVTLESMNHLLLPDEPAFARFVAEVRAFLAT